VSLPYSVDIVDFCGSMEEVMMRHFSGLLGSVLTAAAESDAFSFTVATSGATRLLLLEQPEKTNKEKTQKEKSVITR